LIRLSLEHDYEVTGLELDTLAHIAWEQEGVLGARMTGAGFGGCAIALVNKDKVEDFKKAVGQRYEEVIGYAPSFYIAEVAGVTRVTKVFTKFSAIISTSFSLIRLLKIVIMRNWTVSI